MERCVCIHGHFYQPPRENPWLELIEEQESAHPFHDWNERINKECYATNASARILNDQGKIIRIVSNYERISFNFGPTLLSWMEEYAPETYQAVLEADIESRRRFSGHGSAIAQAYNHMIMPLAGPRDKRTQVVWGIRDFESRFRRPPEGMWLPETAVDIDTLEALAESGIKYTILAPHQARRFRRIGERPWQDAGPNFNYRQPYLQRLPSGREIAIFFYHGVTSRAIAFEGLLNNGLFLAQRLLAGLSPDDQGPQIMSVATDGETFGHHHRFGEMALAYALDHIEQSGSVKLTNYGEFLERFPPAHEVEIQENTAWSCAHGLERWQSDCGCHVGGGPGWNQAWRKPLREALDWLRDYVHPLFFAKAQPHLVSPWRARDKYISVILDRNPENVVSFLAAQASRPVNETTGVEVLRLLELQRHAMLMYTSCGWFFDDISGIETTQILQYAARVIQLADVCFGEKLESRFLQILGRAKSNIPRLGTGRRVYAELVRPAVADMPTIGAHYAVRALICEDRSTTGFACYDISPEDIRDFQAEGLNMRIGRGRLISRLTTESEVITFAALRPGSYDVRAYIASNIEKDRYDALVKEASEAVHDFDAGAISRLLQRHFPEHEYSLQSLTRDERGRVLDCLLLDTIGEAEEVHRRLYEKEAPLLRFFTEMNRVPPLALRNSAQLVLNADLRRSFEAEEPEPERIKAAIKQAKLGGIALDALTLSPAVESALERLAERFFESPHDVGRIERLRQTTTLALGLGIPVDLRRVQNYVFEIQSWVYPEIKAQTDRDYVTSWTMQLQALTDMLGIAAAG